jgi:gamma-glutamylcyclotransferase (GGCT)/AIG2-like uncharacterized protein YtfP
VTELLRVFVYGTLKPEEENHDFYCKAWMVEAREAFMYGQLYDLPFGYPAMTVGRSPVYGFILSFADPNVLIQLDQLEEYDPSRPIDQNEYIRVAAEAFDLHYQPLGQVWVYQMAPELVQRANGILLTNGKWTSRVGM